MAALWAGLLPFVLVSLIAAGTMPGRTAKGIELVLCTGHGIERVIVDPVTLQRVSDEDAGYAEGDCAWATGKPVFGLAQGPLILPPFAATQPARPVTTGMILAIARATGLPPSTGPPLSV